MSSSSGPARRVTTVMSDTRAVTAICASRSARGSGTNDRFAPIPLVPNSFLCDSRRMDEDLRPALARR